MIIDAHSHVHDPVHSHVALLDEAGVDRAVLFGTRPHPERATDLESLRRELDVLHSTVSGRFTDGYQAAWDELSTACAAYPGRFIGFGKVRPDRTALARRYAGVPLMISQLGGLNWLTAIELARETPNLYLDLSTANITFAVRLAIAEVPGRTLFGSDAPYGDPVLARTAVERVTQPGALRDRVLGGTLAELLGL